MTAAVRMFSSSVAIAIVSKLLEIHSPAAVATMLLSSSSRVVMVSVVRVEAGREGRGWGLSSLASTPLLRQFLAPAVANAGATTPAHFLPLSHDSSTR